MADPTDLIIVAYSPSERKLYNINAAAPTAAAVQAALARVVAVDNVAAVTAADATTEATSYALANALKTTVNAILAALKEHGLMVADAG